MIQVKVFITLNIDSEEYPVPVDGDLTPDIDAALTEYFFDMDGVKIQSLKVLQETDL
tara:strand:- start:280 stop:450 length:171 start_codon:yes stop_codon:yes gene_type:complete